MSPLPSIQPLVLLSHASLGDWVMKTASPCHEPVVGLDICHVPRLLITTMSPSRVFAIAFDSHSLVPSGFMNTLTVLICPPLNLPVICPSSFISILTPCGVI